MNPRPRVKICGITRAEDAALAVRLGASALGFIFWPDSPRAVTVETARAIARLVPPLVARVGVFVNAPVETVAVTTQEVGLDAVQLHGDEPVSDYRAVPARLIKAVTLVDDHDVRTAADLPPHVTPLVDVLDLVRRGGTGRTVDWTRARDLAARRFVILAGGLTPENVRAAVDLVDPWAVDVSSGVESAPGIKSPERLARFFAAVTGGSEAA